MIAALLFLSLAAAQARDAAAPARSPLELARAACGSYAFAGRFEHGRSGLNLLLLHADSEIEQRLLLDGVPLREAVRMDGSWVLVEAALEEPGGGRPSRAAFARLVGPAEPAAPAVTKKADRPCGRRP